MNESKKLKNEVLSKNSTEKVDWIYEKRGHDTEEYLLGKKFDDLKDDDDENVADKVETFDDAIAKRSELDMRLKMREDPLYAIKLKEEEARRRVLQNPLKLKKLQKLKEKDKKRENKKAKKSHKKEKLKDESDEEANDLLKKYLELKNIRKRKAKNEGDDSSDSDDHKNVNFGLNIKRKYTMPNEHKKVDYSNLNFKTPQPSATHKKENRKKLTDEEKEKKRREMMKFAEKTVSNKHR